MPTTFSAEQLAKAQYGNFDLGQFRFDAAALCKYLIRARERFDPGFLGDSTQYHRWKLDNISEDHESAESLL